MVFNVTFNNILVISWRSVLLVGETGVPGEKHRLSQVTDKLYHIMLYVARKRQPTIFPNDCYLAPSLVVFQLYCSS